MYLPVTSRAQVLIPLTGPPGVDLTQYAAEIAMVADTGTEPLDADYHAATWVDRAGNAATGNTPRPVFASITVGVGSSNPYPAGQYMAYARLTVGGSKPVLPSGRVRVGDPRLI